MRAFLIPLALLAWSGAACAAPGGSIPFKQDAGAGAAWDAAGGAVLLVSCIVIAAVLWARKRLKFGAPAEGAQAPRMLRVLESQRLGPRAVLSVVEFKGEHYLLSYSEQGVSCLVSPQRETKA